jgi:hypothetical protein
VGLQRGPLSLVRITVYSITWFEISSSLQEYENFPSSTSCTF